MDYLLVGSNSYFFMNLLGDWKMIAVGQFYRWFNFALHTLIR